MNDFLTEFNKIQITSQQVDYRLYYNKQDGLPIVYTMEDLPGDYISITAKEYAVGNYNVVVQNNAIVVIDDQTPVKLVLSESGTPTLAENMMIVDVGSNTHWDLKICY